jgi:phosphoglucosamine mutase
LEESEKKVRCLFGTDGVRDVANRGVMTPEMALRLGRSYVLYLTERGVPRPRIVIGRDTRRSGNMLVNALVAGMLSAGAQVLSLGVIPTPGVSFAIKQVKAQGGVVVSASHNPAEYNGIKFLNSDGHKLCDDAEASIEEYLGDNLIDDWRPTGASIGEVVERPDIAQSYARWLASLASSIPLLDSRIAFDCAHGAASDILHVINKNRGVSSWMLTGDAPDGLNINEGVGVMNMAHIASVVKEENAQVGIAYDGDADRVLLTDSLERVLDGDIILWVLARWLASQRKLGSGVVATVMSNLSLEEHLKKDGIQVFRCPVGDRYVLEMMKHRDSCLGGEQSGHVIISEFTSTGDGICTGFIFLRACSELGENIDSLVDTFDRYPQLLRNVEISRSRSVDPAFISHISQEANQKLMGQGRVLIRPSGTEPLMRVLVEAKDPQLMREVSKDLVDQIQLKCC